MNERLEYMAIFVYGIPFFGIVVSGFSDVVFGTEWFDSYVKFYLAWLFFGFFIFLGIAILYWLLIGWWGDDWFSELWDKFWDKFWDIPFALIGLFSRLDNWFDEEKVKERKEKAEERELKVSMVIPHKIQDLDKQEQESKKLNIAGIIAFWGAVIALAGFVFDGRTLEIFGQSFPITTFYGYYGLFAFCFGIFLILRRQAKHRRI